MEPRLFIARDFTYIYRGFGGNFLTGLKAVARYPSGEWLVPFGPRPRLPRGGATSLAKSLIAGSRSGTCVGYWEPASDIVDGKELGIVGRFCMFMKTSQ